MARTLPKYYCINCDEELTEEEAIVQTLPEHTDYYHGHDPAVYEVVTCCPRCGGVDCVRGD
jgi:hypothetical protein